MHHLVFILLVSCTVTDTSAYYENVSRNIIVDNINNINTPLTKHVFKRCKSRVVYYSNTCATFNIIIKSGDVEQNPGPNSKCQTCEKTVRKNQKRCLCDQCLNVSHAACLSKTHIVQSSRLAYSYTCNSCLIHTLPFCSCRDLQAELNISLNTTEIDVEALPDVHLNALANPNSLKLVPLNTQSLTSRFNEFLLTFEKYKFDVITMSETWLKDNHLLLDHVAVPGYDLLYNNRNTSRGGGVGCYISANLNYKRRNDLENVDLENIWVELPGRNKNTRLLVGIMYRPPSLNTAD